MGKTGIMADTTCDLSEELLKHYNITTFPLHIHLGDEEYSDGIDITPDDIYKWSDENKATPKTSALSLYEACEYLNEKLEDYDDVICFCISEDMSSCYNVMKMAMDELQAQDRVYIINSASLSTGIGLQVVEAAIMAAEGVPASDIVKKIEKIKPFVRASFVVDTLTYLHRGGRCSGLAAMAGGVLKLHPYISVVDGKMGPGKKYRGKMEKVILEYVKDLMSSLENAIPDRVFITHSGCDAEIINIVKEQIEKMNYFKDIHVTRAGSVITSHCGPGTLGVLFIAGD